MRSGARLCAGLGLLLAVSSGTDRARGESSRLMAGISCASIAAPGRILCELRASAPSGKLVWADALVVSAPAFARPLRSRVALQLAAGTSLASAKVALVGAQPGKGELSAIVRGVVCQPGPSGEVCRPEQQRVSAEIEVGGSAPPAPSAAPAPAPSR